jgi:hypothetical protein
MKDIAKGILVVLVTLVLFGLSMKARAGTEGELRELLNGKSTVYQGTCSLGAQSGKFEKDEKTPRVVHNCIVGVDMNEPGEIYYVLIQDRRGRAVRLIKVDKDKDTQTDLWKQGTEV